jgi:hypothetical protein
MGLTSRRSGSIAGQFSEVSPYTSGRFLPSAGLLAFGRRHGQARRQGFLFAAGRLLAIPALGPILETAGRAMPRYGAVQVLTVTTRR